MMISIVPSSSHPRARKYHHGLPVDWLTEPKPQPAGWSVWSSTASLRRLLLALEPRLPNSVREASESRVRRVTVTQSSDCWKLGGSGKLAHCFSCNYFEWARRQQALIWFLGASSMSNRKDTSIASYRSISEQEIARAISDGVTKLIVIENLVYDVTNYTNRYKIAAKYPTPFTKINSNWI